MSIDNKVVPFGAPHTKAPTISHAQARGLIKSCESIAVNHMQRLLQRMFDKADDTLFELAEKANDSSAQSIYFDSMRIVRFKRQEIEKTFIDMISDLFTNFWNDTSDEDEHPVEDDLSCDNLELLDESGLEESLAIANLANKIKSYYLQDISAIKQRLNHIAPGKTITDKNNPLGPSVLCETFRDATENLETDIKIKLIIFKLFDHHILPSMGPFYTEVNNLFIKEGILPVLKTSIKKTPDVGINHPQQNNFDEANSQPSQQSSDQNDNSVCFNKNAPEFEVFRTFQNLLAASRQQGQVSPVAGSAASMVPPGSGQGSEQGYGQEQASNFGTAAYASSQDILAALSGIQARQPDITYTEANEPLGVYIKSVLLDEVQKAEHGGKTEKFNPVDNDIIDVVSMLFEFILEDDNLPDSAKALISRLQIPILKVAITDHEFFGMRGHAARKLLNELAKAGLGLDDDSTTANSPLLAKIESVVNLVLDGFVDDVRLFSDLLDDFTEFLAQEARREEEIKESTKKSYHAREEHALARSWVIETIRQRLADKDFPETIHDLITGPWMEVMLHSFLNEGQDSALWKDQLRFIDVLVWTVQPKQMNTDRNKMARVIYKLLSTLRDGLVQISCPPESIDAIFGMLEPYHYASLKGEIYEEENEEQIESENKTTDAISEAIARMEREITDIDDIDTIILGPEEHTETDRKKHVPEDANKVIMENIVLSGWVAEDEQDMEPQPDDEYLQLAQHLEMGKWVEFIDEDNNKQRAKLAWKSDLLGEFTFLNWKFDVVADKSLQGLAADFRRGSARIIDDIPILDRAINAVMTGLKSKAG